MIIVATITHKTFTYRLQQYQHQINYDEADSPIVVQNSSLPPPICSTIDDVIHSLDESCATPLTLPSLSLPTAAAIDDVVHALDESCVGDLQLSPIVLESIATQQTQRPNANAIVSVQQQGETSRQTVEVFDKFDDQIIKLPNFVTTCFRIQSF